MALVSTRAQQLYAQQPGASSLMMLTCVRTLLAGSSAPAARVRRSPRTLRSGPRAPGSYLALRAPPPPRLPRDTLGLAPSGGYRLSGFWGRGEGLFFERYRRGLARGAVASAAVVDALDPGADGVDRLGSGGEGVPVVELGLQGGPEALDLGVVPAHAGAPDPEQHAKFLGGLASRVEVYWHPRSASKITPAVSPSRNLTARASADCTRSGCNESEKA